MPKRKERIAPPPKAAGWDFRYANNDAVKGWEQIVEAKTVWLTSAHVGHPKATE